MNFTLFFMKQIFFKKFRSSYLVWSVPLLTEKMDLWIKFQPKLIIQGTKTFFRRFSSSLYKKGIKIPIWRLFLSSVCFLVWQQFFNFLKKFRNFLDIPGRILFMAHSTMFFQSGVYFFPKTFNMICNINREAWSIWIE